MDVENNTVKQHFTDLKRSIKYKSEEFTDIVFLNIKENTSIMHFHSKLVVVCRIKNNNDASYSNCWSNVQYININIQGRYYVCSSIIEFRKMKTLEICFVTLLVRKIPFWF